MIVNSTNSNKVREFFSALPEEFYLTGSRFFEVIEDSTTNDWDFFVRDSIQLEDLLREKGFFILNGNRHYQDPSIHTVMRGYIDGHQVDVQFTLPEYLEAKIKAQEKIKKLMDAGVIFPFENKGMMREIWKEFIDSPIPEIDFRSKINLIKGIRAYTGCGLLEGKLAADRFYEELDKLKK